MSNACMLIVMGLPGSGKTTLCKYIMKESKKYLGDNTETIHFCYDELQDKLQYDDYKVFRVNAKDLVEYNLKTLPTSDNKHIFIIDDVMYFKSMRKQYYTLCRKYSMGFCVVHVKIELETALERNAARITINRVLSDTIIEINSKLEPPSEPWEHFHCMIDSNEPFSMTTTNIIWDMIKAAMNKCETIPAVGKSEFVEDPVKKKHTIDLILRKFISNKISETKDLVPDTNISILGKHLSQKKKEFMDQKTFEDFDFNEPDTEELIKLLFQDFIS